MAKDQGAEQGAEQQGTTDLAQLGEQLRALGHRMTEACTRLQAERGATDPDAKVLQHAESHVRLAADVLTEGREAIERALAHAPEAKAAEPEG
jgi:hypothetical protein